MEPNYIFKELKNECDNFLNINHILSKLKFDKFLLKLHNLFSEIISNEIQFALKEIKNIESSIKKVELENEVKLNNNIFKENLKLISCKLIDKISENLFKDRKTKNLNNIIKEEDNENDSESDKINDPNLKIKYNANNLKLNLKKSIKKKKFFEREPLSEKRNIKKKKSSTKKTTIKPRNKIYVTDSIKKKKS